MSNGAELLVKALKARGVRVIFGVSGTKSLSILDVLYNTPEIRYIQSQHEQAAMYMANGYARATNGVGVCLVSPGPGATNALSAVAQAYYTSTPSILISSEENTTDEGLGASVHHNLEAGAIFKPVTKFSRSVKRTEIVPQAVQQAFQTVLSGRRGPAYLGMPGDVLEGKTDVEVAEQQPWVVAPVRGEGREVEKAARLLLAAKRPVVLAGGGVNCAQANGELLELAELLAMPVGVSIGHKGIVPEDHALALGVVGHASVPPTAATFPEADVVLVVGCTLNAFTTLKFGHKIISREAKIIQVDIDPTEIGKIYPVAAGIAGDAKLVLQDIIQIIKDETKGKSRMKEGSPWLKEVLKRKAEWAELVKPLRESNQVPITTFRLLSDLRKALPRDAVVGGASGGSGSWFNHIFQALVPEAIAGHVSWHALGGDYCEALGTKVALPDKVVVCFTGDGSLMMCLAELATAAVNDIRLLCVIRHNRVFGNMRSMQLKKYGGRFIATDVPTPNLAAIAQELGNYGERVELPDEIIPAVKRALESGKPALLEVMTDRSDEDLVPPRTMI